MSKEDLKGFLHSAEHSHSLRRAIRNCDDIEMILNLAKDYGFSINYNDLQNDISSQSIKKWFSNSKLSPLKKI